MIKSGALFKHKTDGGLIEIITTYDKRDIDPDCPLSVAIVGMVKFIHLTGERQGRVFSSSRQAFRRLWEVVNAEA